MPTIDTSPEKINKFLKRGVEKIMPFKEGLAALMRSQKIRGYIGIDPTGSKLHLGHTIGLRKLQEFADLGHEAILVIGTGTVLAGDPSQKDRARQKITQKDIKDNITTWKQQVSKILDFSKVKIKYNSDWLLKLNLVDIIGIASNISAVQLFKRDMFRKRIKDGKTVWAHEMLYPLLQGYDSVAMDVDLEIGGTDQTFNMLIGRELQNKMAHREKYILVTPLISGTDGKPMSKTSNNCVWITDGPIDMFGKIMTTLDSQIEEYWKTLTELPTSKLRSLKPLEAKKELAYEIVKIYHTPKEARKAKTEFERVFQRGLTPKEIPVIISSGFSSKLLDLLVNTHLIKSKTEARRLIIAGAVEINGKEVRNPLSMVNLKSGVILKIGKRRFVKIVAKT